MSRTGSTSSPTVRWTWCDKRQRAQTYRWPHSAAGKFLARSGSSKRHGAPPMCEHAAMSKCWRWTGETSRTCSIPQIPQPGISCESSSSAGPRCRHNIASVRRSGSAAPRQTRAAGSGDRSSRRLDPAPQGGELSHRDGQRRRPWWRGVGRLVAPLPWYALLQRSHTGILPVLGGFRLIVVLCRPPAPEGVIRARPEIDVYVVNITPHVLIGAERGHHKILSLPAARNDTQKIAVA